MFFFLFLCIVRAEIQKRGPSPATGKHDDKHIVFLIPISVTKETDVKGEQCDDTKDAEVKDPTDDGVKDLPTFKDNECVEDPVSKRDGDTQIADGIQDT